MDALAQLNSSLAGRYNVEREIGRGGMATVYVARDMRHDRRVALKVLNPELGAVLGVERFLAEIRVTANLQHPNLLPLFDSGEADGLLFYVMPYVDGESLRARLQREKQLPIDQAVHVATSVASALDHAHRHGVIHRDLKPENILLHEGQPVVADFGIALAVSNAGGGRVTQTGISLGTPQYMSPEQATGDRAIDGRTDVYSLGAVLYEMLTGEPPHDGTTAQAIIAKVITDRPRSPRLTRDTVPPHIEGAVEKALAKIPADRFHTAREFADALVGKSVVLPANFVTPSALAKARKPLVSRIARAWYVWAPWAGLGVVAMLYVSRQSPPAPGIPTTRFALALPASATLNTIGGFLEMSPTGRGFVLVGQSAAGPQLFYRAMDDAEIKPIPGTDNGTQPFVSFDGEWIGFTADRSIMKVAVNGGPPQKVVDLRAADLGATVLTTPTWTRDGRIVVGALSGTGLMQVPASGGTLEPLTQLDSGETSHRGPYILADGVTVLFNIWRATGDDPRIAFVTPDGKVTRTSYIATKARQVAENLIIYSNWQGTIFGARFDPKRFVIGEGVPIMTNVHVRRGGFSGWGASLNGSLLAVHGEPTARLMSVDRAGVAKPLSLDARTFAHPRVSPDGSRIAVQVGIGSSATSDIWMLELASQTLSRLTFDGVSSDPIWSRDGRRIAFAARAATWNPETDIFWQMADGSAQAEPLVRAPGRQWPYGWGVDSSLILDEITLGLPMRVSAIRPGRTSTEPIVRAPATAVTQTPSVSPDGRLVAYASNESGRMEVYVAPLPGPGPKWLVSTAGGEQPLWARSGKELFYRDGANVIAVRVSTSPSFAILGRAVLFEDTYLRLNTSNWDIMPGDQRFVMLKALDLSAQLVVVTNLAAEIERRLVAAGR